MTPAEVSDKVAAHEATLDQMNARLGSIEAMLRELQTRLSTLAATTATRTEIPWAVGLTAGWLTTLIVVSVGVLLKYR
jgi:hypothetical protein